MTKKEAAQILAIVRAVYPNIKIEDAGATLQGWMLELGDFSASAVMKAARLHMATSKYFPTPAEIREKIVRAELIYSDSEIDPDKKLECQQPKLLGNDIDVVVMDDIDDRLENFCKWIGLGYPNEIEN